MRKILVTADWHICEKYDLTQINSLLSIVVEEANKRDELWVLGDIFHNPKASPLELLTFTKCITKVKVPIIIIAGNHDLTEDNSLVDWVPSFTNITVSKSSIRTIREDVNILLGHYNVEESVLGAYDFKLKTGLSVEQLDTDLALLGHIHKSQHIQGTKTQVVHPGSIFYLDYAERNDLKCLVDLTINAGTYKIEHIPLNPDPIIQLDITPETTGEILEDISIFTKVKLLVHYSDPTLNKREVIKRFDKYQFKDKKIVFVYDPKKTNEEHVTTEIETIENLSEYLDKNASVKVKELIQTHMEKNKDEK